LGLFAYTYALAVVATGSDGSAGLLKFLDFCKYLVTLVVPYAAPFAVAVLVHPEWRGYFRAPSKQANR